MEEAPGRKSPPRGLFFFIYQLPEFYICDLELEWDVRRQDQIASHPRWTRWDFEKKEVQPYQPRKRLLVLGLQIEGALYLLWGG
jgi:hypothetical protein